MIQEFITQWERNKGKIEGLFRQKHPQCYHDIVTMVVSILDDGGLWDTPDPQRIYEIDDGDYQGTLVYVIRAKGYQPWQYWVVKVGYGSCSVCDTLQSIYALHSGDKPTDTQVKDYMMLALHIVQGLKAV